DGSMINYAKYVLELGFSVVILNSNEDFGIREKFILLKTPAPFTRFQISCRLFAISVNPGIMI
ncbi:18395_t:CDS:2, partial [Racocetra persica]